MLKDYGERNKRKTRPTRYKNRYKVIKAEIGPYNQENTDTLRRLTTNTRKVDKVLMDKQTKDKEILRHVQIYNYRN